MAIAEISTITEAEPDEIFMLEEITAVLRKSVNKPCK